MKRPIDHKNAHKPLATPKEDAIDAALRALFRRNDADLTTLNERITTYEAVRSMDHARIRNLLMDIKCDMDNELAEIKASCQATNLALIWTLIGIIIAACLAALFHYF